MKILQINTSVSYGSVGRLADIIGDFLIENGHDSYIGYGRINKGSASTLIRIGKKADVLNHVLKTRLYDRHGFGSKRATESFIKYIKGIDPDLVHIHNAHGYYLNIELLFKYLKDHKKPVVWTFHDCWPFTGHCSYFDSVNCYKWQSECYDCSNRVGYPKSLFLDNSRKNFRRKNAIFNGVEKMVLVTPSVWLANHLENSFLSDYRIKIIKYGLDIDKFKPSLAETIRKKYNLPEKFILGVANIWDKRKGFDDFIRLRGLLKSEIEIVLLGLSNSQISKLPLGIKGIPHTGNLEELVELYSASVVFVNPTYADNFPFTNIEALACGTPVITYNSGGSADAINSETGIVVERGNIRGLHEAVNTIIVNGKTTYASACRRHAELNFNKNDRIGEYLDLYKELTE